MSEARAVTNFAGNAVATVLIATWTGELDREQLGGAGRSAPFDEATMIDEDAPAAEPAPAETADARTGAQSALA